MHCDVIVDAQPLAQVATAVKLAGAVELHGISAVETLSTAGTEA